MFRHYKNGKLYKTIDTCMIQENGEWVEAYIYKAADNKSNFPKFVRSCKEFHNKFKYEGK